MTSSYSVDPVSRRPGPRLDAGRLWAGGAATALVAGLLAATGVLIIRGLLDIDVLAAGGEGAWGDASTAWYVTGAAAGALMATALMQALVTFTPRPVRFFGWIMFLATAFAAATPLVTESTTEAKIAMAVLNLIVGVAIGTLVAGTARSATRPPTTAAPTSAPSPYRWPPAR